MRLNIRGKLYQWDCPVVMGIINMTPDSFAVACRSVSEEEALAVADRMLTEGAEILDIGGMSTRPGAEDVSPEEEWNRVASALLPIRAKYPDAIISVDTFRPEVAERAIAAGADIINDVYGGNEAMTELLARTHVPYVLTAPVPAEDVLPYLAERLNNLRRAGVADVIIDPGLGFGKNLEENFILLRRLSELNVLDCPILMGLSRKSMIYRTLGCSPREALNGTTALHMASLMGGANILRAHDVREAVETIRLYEKVMHS